jgi:hypothetical protein
MADDELKLRITPEVDEDALKRAQAEIDGISGKVNLGGKGKGSGVDAALKAELATVRATIDANDLKLRKFVANSLEEENLIRKKQALNQLTAQQANTLLAQESNARENMVSETVAGYQLVEKQLASLDQANQQVINRQKQLFYAQERAQSGFSSMSRSMGGLTSSTKDANIAFANFGRIVQDAPFGLLGISNNIDPLLNSFAQLKASTGSTALALRAMGATLLGPAGLIFLLGSLLPTALLFAQKAMAKSKKETDETTESLTDYQRALRSASQTQVGEAIPSTLTYTQQIEALSTALMSASTSIGIQNLEIVNASQFFKNGAVDLLGYTKAQERLGAMTTETRQALAGASQEVFGATVQEDEAVREIIQSKINEAKANQAIEDALKRLNITRRKSAEEIRRERQEQEEYEAYILRRGNALNGGVIDSALRRVSEQRNQAIDEEERLKKAEDDRFRAFVTTSGIRNDLESKNILSRLRLYKQSEAEIGDVLTTGAKIRAMLLEDEERGLIEMMDLSTSIARNAFGDTKAVAVAEALVNTYVGVSRALREYAPPLSGIMAGLQLANGLATVDRIRRTQIGSAPSGGSGAVNQSASIASATQKPFVTDAISPSGANIAGRIGAMNNQPQFNVTATVDRMGLALAVRDGESDISTRQIPFAS